MSTQVEYLFAVALSVGTKPPASRAHGRSGWIKPDGNEVHFICFAEQLAIVPKDATVYLVGDASPKLARFKRKWTKLARLMRRFERPWTAKRIPGGYVVKDASGQALGAHDG